MRLAPLPIWLLRESSFASRAEAAAASCLTTHSTPACIQASILLGEIIRALLLGQPKAAVLSPGFLTGVFTEPEAEEALDEIEGALPLHKDIADICNCGWRSKLPSSRRSPSGIAAAADVTRTLEAALWAFDRTSFFVEGALQAVNLGDDSDTVGAVYGMIAGAHYGLADGSGDGPGIPADWQAVVAKRDEILALADALLAQ